jgi:polysaccharide transporter, PST family
LLKFIKSKDNKRLVGNFLSLSVLQGTNLLLPLITFPYLVRVLGVEKFGLIAFALATVAYFEILTDYGFDLSATRQISIHRGDNNKVTSIFSAVLSIKALLSIVSFLLLTILVFSFKKFSDFFLIYYFTFGRVLGKSIFPVWFFQGMERMRITTYLNILAKAIFTVAIFVFVKEESDFLLVPVFNSLGFVISGLVALIQIRVGFGIRFQPQSKSELIEQLKDGWHIFLSRIYVNIYTTTNTFLLGVMTNNIIVGYYSIAAKIIEAIDSLFIPANNALYPFMSKLYQDSKERFYNLVNKINVIYLIIAVFLVAGALLFGKQLITIVNGSYDSNIYVIYSILCFKILFAPFAPLFTNVLINQNRKSEYLTIVKYTFIFNLLLVPVLIYFYSGVGMASGVLIVVTFHVLLFFVFKLKPDESLQPQ